MRLRLPALLTAAIMVAACGGMSDLTDVPPTPPGALTYNGFDASGQQVVGGWIQFEIPDLVQHTSAMGSWTLKAIAVPQHGNIGPQVGKGTLLLDLTGAETVGDLNPGRTDANVILTGTLTLNGLEPVR